MWPPGEVEFLLSNHQGITWEAADAIFIVHFSVHQEQARMPSPEAPMVVQVFAHQVILGFQSAVKLVLLEFRYPRRPAGEMPRGRSLYR